MAVSGVSRALREQVAARAKHRCEYCRTPAGYNADSLPIEHILPRAKGGTHSEENLALSCLGCNARKGVRIHAPDPVTGDIAPLFHPREDEWRAHFRWSEDYLYIAGETPVGRATVAALGMNRPGLVNQRRLLLMGAEHPPLD